MQNELQNAYALSSMEHNASQADTHAAVAAVVAVGLVAVVEESAAYCPSTDAILRNPHVRLLAALGSYSEAEALVFSVSRDDDYECEVSYKIKCAPELRPTRPALGGKTVFPAPKPFEDDGIPF